MLSKDVDGELTTYSFEYCDGCGLNKRLKKTILAADGTTILSETTYRWDGENIIGEEDEFGNVVDYFVMPFSLMDNVVSMKREGEEYYYLTDAMGSVYQVVDGDGNLVNSYDYNAWGEIRGAQTTETVANPFRWQTKPWDEEIGLYYSRARYYDCRVGRFVSQDPSGSSNNMYSHGPPVDNGDPTGLADIPVFKGRLEVDPSCEEDELCRDGGYQYVGEDGQRHPVQRGQNHAVDHLVFPDGSTLHIPNFCRCALHCGSDGIPEDSLDFSIKRNCSCPKWSGWWKPVHWMRRVPKNIWWVD